MITLALMIAAFLAGMATEYRMSKTEIRYLRREIDRMRGGAGR